LPRAHPYQCPGASVPDCLLYRLDAAEIDERRSPRFAVGEPTPALLLGECLDVRAQLVVQFLLDSTATKQVLQQARRTGLDRHERSYRHSIRARICFFYRMSIGVTKDGERKPTPQSARDGAVERN
jgi:hypothetical protein